MQLCTMPLYLILACGDLTLPGLAAACDNTIDTTAVIESAPTYAAPIDNGESIELNTCESGGSVSWGPNGICH